MTDGIYIDIQNKKTKKGRVTMLSLVLLFSLSILGYAYYTPSLLNKIKQNIFSSNNPIKTISAKNNNAVSLNGGGS